jgi:CHAT domain-containing protein
MVNVVLSCKGPVSDGIFARRRTYGSQQDSSLKPLADSLFKTRWTWDVNAGRVARALPADAVLIEYLKYNHTKIGLETDPRYLAVVVNNKGDIAAFDLGSAGAIDSSVLWYRSYFEYPELTDARDYPRISKGIYDLVIKPFAKKLDHESMVFVAPDGSLNLISFAGLLDEDGQYLIEKYAVHYLSAGRDLLRLEEQPPAGEGLLVMGDPDFDVPAAERMSAAMMAHAPPESSGLTEKSVPTIWSGTQAVTRRKVPRLPSARREVQSVREQWERDNLGPVIAYLGAEASEENFKEQAPGKRVIHLATHGDFVCPGEADRLLAGGPALWEPLYAGEDPLLQSSLLLAGANLCEAGLDTLKAEDGRLTAAEVAAMDLSGTELVVLSGCETGLGEVKSGEGMWGLRRAFQMAGARTVISTLWVIQDNESTVDFVARLYAAKRKDLALLMRDIAMECIQELREGGHPDYPLTWGAFIALGDWRIQ